MKNKIHLIVLSCLIIITSLTDVHAAKFIDQMQPLVDDSSTNAIGGSSEQKLAQTITVGQNGVLKGVYLPVSCESGKLIIEIRDVISGIPGNTILAKRKISATRFSHVVSSFRYFSFKENLTLIAGEQISIVLRNPTGSCGLAKAETGDTYSEGDGFFDSRPNAPGWIPFFSSNAALDLPFMTVIKVP